MEISADSVREREDCLTVVRGCVGTVVAHWDRLDEAMTKTLLETALEKIEDLVINLEHDVAPLRISATRTATANAPIR
jgi:hypothetical protein